MEQATAVHEYTDEIKCPYCNAEYEIDCDSFRHWWDDEETEFDCGECEKTFSASLHVSHSYSTYKMSCEKGKHDFQPHDERVNKRTYDKNPTTGNWEWLDLPKEKWENCTQTQCTKCETRKTKFQKLTAKQLKKELENDKEKTSNDNRFA